MTENQAAQPAHTYVIDPEGEREAERLMRKCLIRRISKSVKKCKGPIFVGYGACSLSGVKNH